MFNVSNLGVFFKDHQYIALKRQELYSHTDFLADVGGLLGLFMGVSALSVVEIFYYLTLRTGCTMNKRRDRKQKKLRKQQQNQRFVQAVEKSDSSMQILPNEIIGNATKRNLAKNNINNLD